MSYISKMFALLALATLNSACAITAEPVGFDQHADPGNPASDAGAAAPIIPIRPLPTQACDPKTDLSGCKAILEIAHLAETDRSTLAGMRDYRAATIKMGVTGNRVAHITSATVTLFTAEDGAVPGPAAFCASPCEASSSWALHNVSLVDANTGELLMGPVAVPVAENGKWPTVHFTGNLEMKGESTRDVAIIVDIANPLPVDSAGKKYNAGLMVDSNETTTVVFLTESQHAGFEIVELAR